MSDGLTSKENKGFWRLRNLGVEWLAYFWDLLGPLVLGVLRHECSCDAYVPGPVDGSQMS